MPLSESSSPLVFPPWLAHTRHDHRSSASPAPVPSPEPSTPLAAVPHLVLPWAISSEEACQALWPQLALPTLQRLFALSSSQRLETWAAPDTDPELTLTPPHEWVLARAWGLLPPHCGSILAPRQADGQLPWAAFVAALATPGDPVPSPAAWFTPCHQEVGTGQVSLSPPAWLDLSAAHSQALMEALRPLAQEDGIDLQWLTPTCWLAQGPVFDALPSASLDRVTGRSIAPWLSTGPAAASLRRLQTEAQMLFYNHPANDEREAQRQVPVNAFWISGSGACPPTARRRAPELVVPNALRHAALQGDWAAWREAWQWLDAQALPAWLQHAQRGHPMRLTLCGERASLQLDFSPRNIWQNARHKISSIFGTSRITGVLYQL